jgi:thiol-disulfide isomerase/thioredoxin
MRPELMTRDDRLVMSNPVLSIPASGGPSLDLPGNSVNPPACVLVGNRLETLVLRDVNGNPWNFRSDRRGKLVLFDFWYSDCMPCMRSVPHMNKLNSMYERFGLQVVGLAYEPGSFNEQVARVRDTQSRKAMNYISLIGTGDSCPVRRQFDVHSFPSLVLVDESGQVVWRSPKGQGVGIDTLREAELAIRQGLRLPSR